MEDSKDTPLDRFADNLLARIDEPKIGEMTISEAMTRQSLESARMKYKDRAREECHCFEVRNARRVEELRAAGMI